MHPDGAFTQVDLIMGSFSISGASRANSVYQFELPSADRR
ncbi:hypothetical protein I551_9190 [Mycobacterium ulcerans str. Harvey]|uniref:Uncharacterized protein n=1 Tax=Mycobacterium ulcerans str. Harvey TaxID=1299332 RepID=A0ABP3ARA1_MYCUL|nr:hypothetical protein I551_9190 [Mycobacterium ulcerans str. Harvey]